MIPPYLVKSVLRFVDVETLLQAQEVFKETLQDSHLWILLCQQHKHSMNGGPLWREHFWSQHQLQTNWLTGKCSTVHQNWAAIDEAFLSISPLMAVALPCRSPSATIHRLETRSEDKEEIYSQQRHAITCVCQEGPYVVLADCVGRITAWQRGTSGNRPIGVFEGNGVEVGALLLDAGHVVVAGAEDGSITIYSWPGSASPALPARLHYTTSPVTALERGLFVGHANGMVARYEKGKLSVVASIESPVYCLARAQADAVLVGCADGRVHLINGDLHVAFKASHQGGIVCMHHNRLLLLTGTADGVIQAWHPTKLQKLWELREDHGKIIWRLHCTEEHLLSSSIGGGLRIRSFKQSSGTPD